MSKRPVVSVCIPCYNGAKFLAHTLESVFAQTFTDFELILTDDKSTDETVSVIKAFKDTRIRFSENERNLGLGFNWHRVMSQSKGKYVKLLCEDDILHPECLDQQVGILENMSNRGVALTVCRRKVINVAGEVILSRSLPFTPGLVSGATLISKSVRWGSNLIGEPAVGLFRREALELGTCDLSNPYLADFSLWAHLLKRGDVFLDNRFLAAFRISHEAVSTRTGFGQAAAFRKFVQTLRRDPFYRINNLDVILGYAFSSQWCLFRNLFIKLHSGRIRGTAAKSALDVCSTSSWLQATGATPQTRRRYFDAVVN